MNEEKGYPKYQYSVFLQGNKSEQIVIRTDTFQELMDAKKKVNLIIDKVESKTEQVKLPIHSKDADPKWVQEGKGAECVTCGKPATVKNGIGKTGRAWKGVFCSSGDKTHTVWL